MAGRDVIRLLLVEDHRSFREALAAVCELHDDLEVVGAVDRGDQAGPAAARTHPDVALVDLDLPGGDGVAALDALREASPGTAGVVLTGLTDEVELGRAVEAGAVAVVHKNIEIDDLLGIVRDVAAGRNLLDAPRAAAWLRAVGAAREQGWYARVVRDSLTPRESSILVRLARGGNNTSIAAELGISPQTVQTHVRGILAKLRASSRLEAVTEAIRLGLVDPHVDVRPPPQLPADG